MHENQNYKHAVLNRSYLIKILLHTVTSFFFLTPATEYAQNANCLAIKSNFAEIRPTSMLLGHAYLEQVEIFVCEAIFNLL